MKIVLDCGHGQNTYTDTGAKGLVYDGDKVFEEFTFNSAVVRKAKHLAELNGIEVLLTQPLDGYDVPLSTRTNIIKNGNVDLVISFHADANPNLSARGHWCFYWYTHNESKRLAQIWDKHANAIMNNGCRGVVESKSGIWTDFHMCREPARYNIPAILCEHDFFTNPEGRELLMSEEFQNKCAETAIRAACEFLGLDYKEEEYMLPVWIADVIINTWLSPAWFEADARGDQQTKDNMKLLANELRKASGQEVQ